mmetsp:Transcript_16219/g.48201  ORF Transcript_16219/g.48201 Transcript_16219/m.48201 type:complete len:367 (+) Transcript_16219:165-1265(+)
MGGDAAQTGRNKLDQALQVPAANQQDAAHGHDTERHALVDEFEHPFGGVLEPNLRHQDANASHKPQLEPGLHAGELQIPGVEAQGKLDEVDAHECSGTGAHESVLVHVQCQPIHVQHRAHVVGDVAGDPPDDATRCQNPIGTHELLVCSLFLHGLLLREILLVDLVDADRDEDGADQPPHLVVGDRRVDLHPASDPDASPEEQLPRKVPPRGFEVRHADKHVAHHRGRHHQRHHLVHAASRGEQGKECRGEGAAARDAAFAQTHEECARQQLVIARVTSHLARDSGDGNEEGEEPGDRGRGDDRVENVPLGHMLHRSWRGLGRLGALLARATRTLPIGHRGLLLCDQGLRRRGLRPGHDFEVHDLC